ncbi:siderophore-interacting protein [Chitinophaga pendula]|uniref:siderophore-interacting protein n=1 Tax=Chitinophaga TaxID=79328 RepID=UPI000BB0740A|nr:MULTISPECIES: siderophore-interacting protein [Chitinophaga]ASZ11116.1 hypothetical protein CK934_09150 [Chitinophaga sp. MD30]UCJ05887.1 siderophore-interacting protein [Chitinophaga pendula]
MPAIKDRAAAFLMSRIGAHAGITAISHITPSLIAISAHLPQLKGRWASTQHLKCMVAPYTFRDYTLARWDEQRQTGTLLIDVSHDGAGSDYIRRLQVGDILYYAGPGGGMHQPGTSPQLVCIGDMSAIGHFMSLYLRKDVQQEFHCIIHSEDAFLPSSLWGMELDRFSYQRDSLASVRMQLQAAGVDMPYTTYFVAGRNSLVKDVRVALKDMRVSGSQIKSAGFWR